LFRPQPDLPDDGPVITGGFPRYHLGDKVNVNCTSYRSKPAAKLRWYINGEQADFALTKNYPVIIYVNSFLNIRFKKLIFWEASSSLEYTLK
jgi:hypothetical protein